MSPIGLFDEDEALDMLSYAAEAPDTTTYLSRAMTDGCSPEAEEMESYVGAAAASLVADSLTHSVPEDPLAADWMTANEIDVDQPLISVASAAIECARGLGDPGFFFETADSEAYLDELDKVEAKLIAAQP